MKERTEFYNGYLYRIEKVRHNCFYGNTKIFHIRTNNPTWAASVLPKVLGDDSMTIGEFRLLNKRKPCIENSLKTYHSVEFVDDTSGKVFGGYYKYTIRKPYDD